MSGCFALIGLPTDPHSMYHMTALYECHKHTFHPEAMGAAANYAVGDQVQVDIADHLEAGNRCKAEVGGTRRLWSRFRSYLVDPSVTLGSSHRSAETTMGLGSVHRDPLRNLGLSQLYVSWGVMSA